MLDKLPIKVTKAKANQHEKKNYLGVKVAVYDHLALLFLAQWVAEYYGGWPGGRKIGRKGA